MPRQPRLEPSGVPMHVVQRGVNREQEGSESFVALMDNHAHLLVSADKAGAVSSAMRLSGQ
ncbi:putative transposase [Xanthomonas arboricola]|nr:putative transposase [Xanthomonas campestris]MCW2009597.1 putative transposase [Xanthomonas campestris]